METSRRPWRAAGGSGWVVLALAGCAASQADSAAPAAGRHPLPPARTSRTARTALVFDGVTVVDVEQGRLVADQRVVITGTRIRAVGAAGRVVLPPGARRVDARGKYLIPGLWDMHVHTGNASPLYPYFIANGITGLRDMHGPFLDSLFLWRREIAAGTRVGPRLVVTGGTITTSEEAEAFGLQHLPNYFGVTTAAEARQAVQALKKAGVDFVKIHNGQFSREVFFAIAAEARRLGLPFAGHKVRAVSAAEASDSGMLSLEHVGEAVCYPTWDGAVQAYGEERPVPTLAQCTAIAERFAKNNTWIMPFGGLGIPAGLTEVPLCAVDSVAPPAPSAPAPCAQTPPAWTVLPVLAGTDFVVGGVNVTEPNSPERIKTALRKLRELPHAPLIGSLAYFVSAGMTPAQALRTATLNPAKALRATDSLGTIAAGKLADLVLLSANPLAEITNTTKIAAVVANGRYFDRAALDGLLAPSP